MTQTENGNEADGRDAQKLRLLTYNIRKGYGASGRSRTAIDEMRSALAERGDDVVLLQEAFHPRGSDQGQHALLGDALGLRPIYIPNKARRIGHHGNATLVRDPVVEYRNHDISTNPIERRGALHTVIDSVIGRLHVINVHLGLNQRQRDLQVEHIGGVLIEAIPKDQPVVLAGDFNDWNYRLDRRITEELGFANAIGDFDQANRTWPTIRPLFHLDRVYVRHLRVGKVRTLAERLWQRLSDHLPIEVELAVQR